MKRWIVVTTGVILAMGLWGCKLEKSTEGTSLRLPTLHRGGTPDQAAPVPSPTETTSAEPTVETGSEPAPEKEPAATEETESSCEATGEEEKPAEETTSAAEEKPTSTEAATCGGSSAEEEKAESPEEEAAEQEPAQQPETESASSSEQPEPATAEETAAPEKEQPVAVAPTRAGTEPVPGVKRLAPSENARLLDVHLARAEDSLQAMKLASAKQALTGAVRAFSYLDAQRPAAVLAQALDQVVLCLNEKDTVAARMALQRAEDWIENTPLADDKALAESLLELDHQLKAKKTDAAADTVQAVRNKLAQRDERTERILTALRIALVQAQLALERHTPGVALAEVQEARTQAKKLMTPAAATE